MALFLRKLSLQRGVQPQTPMGVRWCLTRVLCTLLCCAVQAQKHQASSRPLKCMAVLVILIVIMLIILFVRKL